MQNTLVAAGKPYTLRKHAATPAIQRALAMGMPLVNGMLGDPVRHGLHPSELYRMAVAGAALKGESWGYGDSFGVPRLRELIQKAWFPKHTDITLYIGAGVSGISEEFMRWALCGVSRNGVIIPESTYILYFFDTAINDGTVQKIALTPEGQVDVDSFANVVDKNTKVVTITTTGNPLGTSMSGQTAMDIIQIVMAKEREYGHPIYLVFDIMYEGFRYDGIEINPIAIAKQCGRDGPTIVVDSLSKRKIVAPGARIGWMAVHWPENGQFEIDRNDFFEEMNALFLPRLGQVPTPDQLGLADLLRDILDVFETRETYEAFDKAHIAEAHRRVRAVLTGLADIDGVIFPGCYYQTPGDQSSGVAYGRVDNSFYINFGFGIGQPTAGVTRDIETPSARKIAEFGIERGLPVIAGTPYDAFLPPEDRGKGRDLMRVVALFDDATRVQFLDGVAAYAEHLRRST